MSDVRHRKRPEPATPPTKPREATFASFTAEQREELLRAFGGVRFEIAQVEDMVGRHRDRLDLFDRFTEAVYRACVGIGRVVRPEKKWDGL